MTRPALRHLSMPIALLVAFASPALANDLVGDYKLTGTHSAAPNDVFASEISIRKAGDGQLRVIRRVISHDGSTSTRSATVDKPAGNELQLRLTGGGGISAAIAPGATPVGATDMQFQYDTQSGKCESRTWDDDGEAVATGERVIEELGGKAGDLLIYTRGGLKSIFGKALRKVFEGGVGVSETLKLHDFLHVGLELETTLLEEGELLPLQRRILAEQTEPHVWLQTDVEGGIRLPFAATIPLGGVANISVGFRPGASLRYEVTDLYKTPEGITDGEGIVRALKQVGTHVFQDTIKGNRVIDGRVVQLPISADKALALQVGAERIVEGELTVAINGSLGVGEDTSALSDVLEVGASARVGGFYRIRDWLRIEMTRLDGDLVRLHLTDGRSKGPGAEARLFVGAALADAEDGGWEPSAEYLEPVKDVGNSLIKKLLRFEIKGVFGNDEKRELDISYRYDLTNASARQAYERAVRGDFTLTAQMYRDPANGVERDFRVFEVEEKLYSRAQIELSEFVDGKLTKDVEIAKLFVQDGAGNNLHRVFRFQKQRKLGLGAIWEQKWDERIYISVIRSDDVDDEQVGIAADGSFDIPVWLAKRSFRFRYDLRDASTRKGEMERLKRVMTQLGLDDADGLPVPERRLFRSRYGKTKARLEVDIAEWGIRTIMGKTLGEPQTVRRAFIASHDRIHGPITTAWHGFLARKNLQKKADKFLEGMQALANNDVPDRAKVLKELAEESGFDLTMLGALVELAPRRTIRVQASIEGKRISYAAEHAGRGSGIKIPNLHGH